MSIKATQSEASDPQGASLSSLKARVQSHPHDGESWLALALRLAHSKPTQDLRQAISRSIELLPDSYQAWLLAGLELKERQGSAGAMQWLNHIAQQRPALAAPRLALAQLQVAAEDPAAEKSFISIIASFPEDSRACLLYAEYLQNQGRLSAAGDYLERTLSIEPDIVGNWIALAKIRLAEQRLDAAVSAATRALELDNTSLEARMTRAEAYRTAGYWPQAKSDYLPLLQSMPESPYVLMGLGASLAGEGEFDEALEASLKAIRIKPDLLEARLNIALVYACQGNSQRALPELEKVLKSTALLPAMQDSARICQVTLLENQRLQKHLVSAGESANLSELQTALNQAPDLLLQSDPQMTERLISLAEACQEVQWPDFVPDYPSLQSESRIGQLPGFVEACLLSRSASNAADIAELWSQISLDPAGTAVSSFDNRSLMDTWQAIIERKAPLIRLQGNDNGEAWLRYSHYQLFRSTAANFPGLFKFAANSIGMQQTIAPQCLIKTVRLLLNEIRPSIPAGLGRACFMLLAINRIHPFFDGNGRLARFAFAGELEEAGIPPILLQRQDRQAMTECIDHAHYGNDFKPFADFLRQVQPVTRDLLLTVAKNL